jgi:hypothetical protein
VNVSFFNALSNKVEEISTIGRQLNVLLGDFLNLSFPTRMKVLGLFDLWLRCVDDDRMILQNNFKIFHLDKDVKCCLFP